jgi:hypothetical protein
MVNAKRKNAAEFKNDTRHRQQRQRRTQIECIAAIYMFERTTDHKRLRRIARKLLQIVNFFLELLRH